MPFTPRIGITRETVAAAHTSPTALRKLIEACARHGLPLHYALDVEPAYYERRLIDATQRGHAGALAVLRRRQNRFRTLRPHKKAILNPGNPWESVEQADLRDYLDAVGLDWFHVPNERASATMAKKLSIQGVKAGVPDVIITTRARIPEIRGVAIELKRRRAASSTVSTYQREWIEKLRAMGWIAEVARGAGEAIAIIELLFDVSWLK